MKSEEILAARAHKAVPEVHDFLRSVTVVPRAAILSLTQLIRFVLTSTIDGGGPTEEEGLPGSGGVEPRAEGDVFLVGSRVLI